MPVPAAVELVRESAGTDATIAHAPGSVELLGETCAATGGMLLATALPVSADVALEPNDTGELIVASTRIGDETPLPMPDAIPAGYPAEVTAVAAAVTVPPCWLPAPPGWRWLGGAGPPQAAPGPPCRSRGRRGPCRVRR